MTWQIGIELSARAALNTTELSGTGLSNRC